MPEGSEISGKVVAVLTGDIVKSSTLTSDRRLFLYEVLQDLSLLLRNQYPQDILFDMAKYRGDGWQLVVNTPGKAFEISLFLRTYIRSKFRSEKLDTRIGIAIGGVDFIPGDNVSEGYGAAFTESGRVLDGLKDQNMGFTIVKNTDSIGGRLIANLIKTHDAFITSWTPLQCQAVHLALQGFTQSEIGNRWQPKSISQAAVAKHLKSANWELIKEGLHLFEEAVNSSSGQS